MKKNQLDQFVEKLKELNINPRIIGFVVNRSTSTISRWKSQENIPELDPRATLRLCRLLDITIEDLANMFQPDDDMKDVDIATAASLLKCKPEVLSRALKGE